ncbi:MAG TPA: hypothetical protein VK589_07070 [Chryseolinea sp.]|nr:hypothetical protein [Chryseolinea sp.]
MRYFGIFMAVFYVAAGIAMLLQPPEYLNISKQYLTPLGIILIAYGAFRGYNIFKKTS